MSMFLTKRTCMNDGKILHKVLGTRFKEVEFNQTPQPLYGYQGDFRTNDGSGHTKDPDKALKAEIIVRRKHVGTASNDIGFRKADDGNYDAVISQYDSGRHGQKWLDDLGRDYLIEKAKQMMSEQEAEFVTQTTDERGWIHLQYRPAVTA